MRLLMDEVSFPSGSGIPSAATRSLPGDRHAPESAIGLPESAIGMSESVIGIRRNRDRLESESGFALAAALACLIADHRLSGIQAASDHPSLFHGHQS